MRIVVPAIGSRGDVQPYIALCQGLQNAGHSAVLATNPSLVALVRSYGVTAAPVGPEVDMGMEGAKIWEKAGRNWMFGFLRTMRFGMRLVEEAFPDILELCRQADLVIATDIGAGIAEADKLGLPWISVTLQPGRVPIPQPALNPAVRAGWSLVGAVAMAPMNRMRKRQDIPPLKGDLSAVLSDRLILLPVSPHVARPDPRWPAHAHATGYWTAREPQDWSPPEDLIAFLAAGEMPIAVSLGAMSFSGKAAREAAGTTVEAVRRSGVRAIVQGWHEALQGAKLPPSVYHAGSMPHTWLFDRVRAVVHHGGFGTTASALRAGVPAVVIPHIIDQYFWGQRVNELGAGPQPIRRFDLSVENLAEAISQVVQDTTMQQRAADLGRKIRAEPDGVETAIHLIHKECAGG